MASNIYLLLGVQEGASLAEIKRAYARLVHSLETAEGDCDPHAAERMQAARQCLSETYERLKDPDVRQAFEAEFAGETYCRPKLGQMLVAAGLITLIELDSALEIQRNTRTTHIPIGELLVEAGYITPQQLDYYLRQQKLMQLPADHPDRWAQRLIQLKMITDDQLKVALIEQKLTGSTLRECFINRGYLTVEELDRIF